MSRDVTASFWWVLALISQQQGPFCDCDIVSLERLFQEDDICSSLQVASFVVTSFTAPTGMITAIYIWAILQIVGCYQIYCRPTFGFAYNYVIRYSSIPANIRLTVHGAVTYTVREPDSCTYRNLQN